ncbi:hypothetical protein ACODUM_03280 [Stenotrophomonas maltophilia]
MSTRVLSSAMALVGALVGAGFASGQEMQQFFVAFGLSGVWGAMLASALMLFVCVAALQLGSHEQAKEHSRVFEVISNPVIAGILDITIVITLFATGLVMLASAGANMTQQFGWPAWLGTGLALTGVLLGGLMDVDKVSRTIATVIPGMVIMLIGISVATIAGSDYQVANLERAASKLQTPLPNWWVAALGYVGLCTISAVSMTIVIGGNLLDSRHAGYVGILGGLTHAILLVMAVLALYCGIELVAGEPLPMLSLATHVSPILGLTMSITIFIMSISSALAMFYALGKRLTRHRPARFLPVYSGVVSAGFAISFIGFQPLITHVYPVLGYLGLAVIAVVGYGWLRNRTLISIEAMRRKSLRDLALRRLDPRRRFTKRHAEKVVLLSEESNLENGELHATLVKRAVEELTLDPALDIQPMHGSVSPSEILTTVDMVTPPASGNRLD